MTGAPARVLCIGLDAASSDLVRRWAGMGELPTLRSLMERGITSEVAGVDGFFVGSTWPSFYTAASPARHGFHYLLQLQPGSYSFHRPGDHGISRWGWRKLPGTHAGPAPRHGTPRLRWRARPGADPGSLTGS